MRNPFKSKPEPTLEEQHNEAAATSYAALSVFRAAAGDLEYAAALQADVAARAREEMERHLDIALAAEAHAEDNIEQARKVQELVGGYL